MGGKNGLTIWDGDDESGESHISTAPTLMLSHFTARSYYDSPEIEGAQDEGAGQGGLDEADDYDEGAWYMGKARDEFNRRKRGQHGGGADAGAGARDEEDPVKWARERRAADAERERAERERDGDFGPEDYFEGALRGQRYREGRDAGAGAEEEVDEFAETMLLVVLCLTVSVLLYVRGRWVERIRREEEERRRAELGQPPRPAGGVFPPHGDPAQDDWAILR